MKLRRAAFALSCIMLCSSPVFAQEAHDLDSMTMDEIRTYVRELESENQYLREQLEISSGLEIPDQGKMDQTDEKIITDFVKDYTGFNLSTVGYTSMGGDLRDYYGNETLKFILVTSDGAYVDPEDEEQLQSYMVVSQFPSPGEEVKFYYNDEDDLVNMSYSEIVLGVQKTGTDADAVQLTQISPSAGKESQFVKAYVGRNLATCGYTAMNGNRYDTYGTGEQRIQLSVVDENGAVVDTSSPGNLKYYIVTGQSPEANTEIKFAYSVDSEGEESITGQTVNNIQLTARITEEGQAELEQKAAEEEELRASGALTELFQGDYKVGSDLREGYYRFKQGSDAVSLNIYQDEAAFNADDGEWDYLYGEEDMGYYMLREGMYISVSGGSVISIWSEIPSFQENEFELYTGVYRIGEDMQPGNYTFAPVSETCDLYLYRSEEAFNEDDGNWDYLYGKDDEVAYALQDGMIVKISDGAAKVTRK